MPDPTPHPQHDLFFRDAFSDTAVAAGFLQSVLPDQVGCLISWHTLSRRAGDFVGSGLRKSEADLIFEAEYLGEGPPKRIVLILEHQSAPDRSMPRRLLRYCEGASGKDPVGEAEFQPLVVPAVFYQGRRPWKHSTQYADLLPEEVRGLACVPRFEFLLVDQTKIGPEDVVGEGWCRLAQLLLMGGAQPDPEEAPKTPEAAAKRKAIAAYAAALAVELEAPAERKRMDNYFDYAESAFPHDMMLRLGELMQQAGSPRGERVTTLSEWSRAEGRAEGLAEGRTEGLAEGEQRATLGVVKGFLDAGASWTLIEKATGLNEARFLALKAKPATG